MDYQAFENLLHPVRLQIMLALRELGTATTGEIAQQCPQIPPATLYRHIAALYKSGVLGVAQETTINGIVQKTYCLAQDIMKQAEATQPQDLPKMALNFSLATMVDFQNYIRLWREHPERYHPEKETGLRYRMIHLNDDEFDAFVRDINRVLDNYDAPPSPQRKPFRFSTVIVPIDEEGTHEKEKRT